MILACMIAILFGGGLLAWYAERWDSLWPRKIASAALLLDAMLVLMLFSRSDTGTITAFNESTSLIEQIVVEWIPRFGISFHLALDGLSLLLIALTVFLGFMTISCSWAEIQQRVGFFHFNLLWTLAGVLGVFLAMDLFLFFIFWEAMIIPMYFLISIWGHENRQVAAIKFFIFTQVSSLLMLISIVALVFINLQNTGEYSFNYFRLLDLPLDANESYWLMLGLFIAFVVKLPVIPFHTWLPDAHTQAPTAGSVILAGVLLKTGAYGLLRFVVPLFPEAALEFTPIAMTLGVISVLYGAKLAFAQSDIKRLIAYTSISHMGFILLGVFAWNAWALQGVVMTMLAHGISSAALFMIAGALQERIHTRDMVRMGALWTDVPRLSAMALFFSIAALGMPGLGNFVGEFLVLLGAFQLHWLLTSLAALGLIVAPVYSLIVIQKAFHGPHLEKHDVWDFGAREMTAMALMVIVMVWMGLYPQAMINVAQPSLHESINRISLLAGGRQ